VTVQHGQPVVSVLRNDSYKPPCYHSQLVSGLTSKLFLVRFFERVSSRKFIISPYNTDILMVGYDNNLP